MTKKPWIPPPCKSTQETAVKSTLSKRSYSVRHNISNSLTQVNRVNEENCFVSPCSTCCHKFFESDYAELLRNLSSMKLIVYKSMDEVELLKEALKIRDGEVSTLHEKIGLEKLSRQKSEKHCELLSNIVDKLEGINEKQQKALLEMENRMKSSTAENLVENQTKEFVNIGTSPLENFGDQEFCSKSTQIFSPTSTKIQSVQTNFFIRTTNTASQTDSVQDKTKAIQTEENELLVDKNILIEENYRQKVKRLKRKLRHFTKDDASLTFQEDSSSNDFEELTVLNLTINRLNAENRKLKETEEMAECSVKEKDELEFSSEDDEESGDEKENFWFKAGQNSGLQQLSCRPKINTNKVAVGDNEDRDINSDEKSSIGKMSDLINKTMKFDDDISVAENFKEKSKFDYIDAVSRKFVAIPPSSGFSPELLKLLQCLCYLCDDERCVTCFMQADGLQRLHEIVKRFVAYERYWSKYRLTPDGVLQRQIGVEAIRLLACLSCFQASRFRLESAKQNLVPILIAFFDPMNSMFSPCPLVDDSTKVVKTLVLSAVNSVHAPLFTKRSLPTASFPFNVFVYDLTNEDENVDPTVIWPYNFDDMQDLHKAKQTVLKKTLSVVNVVDHCTFWAIDPIDQRRILLEVMQISGNKASVDMELCKTIPSVGDVFMSPGDKCKTGPAPTYRCICVDLINLDSCVVFSLDFGFFAEVSWKRLRHVTDKMKAVPAAAVLCVAKNTVAAPTEDVAKLLFVVLQNFGHSLFLTEKLLQIFADSAATQLKDILRKPLQPRDGVFRNFWLSVEYLQADLLSILLKLSNLPLDKYESVLMNVVKIFVQFSSHARIRSQLTERNLIEIVLSLSAKIVELCKSDESKSELLLPIVKFLSNMCADNVAGRSRFEKCNGLVLPMCLIKTYPDTHDLHKTSSVLLKHIFNADNKVTAENFASCIDNLCNLQISNKRDDYVCNLLEETIKLKCSIPSGCCFSKKLADRYVVPVDCNEIYEKFKETVLNPNADVVNILQRIAIPPFRGRFYMKNSYFEISDIEIWNVFFDTISPRDIKQSIIQEYVCAALNSRCKLTLYFGITKEKQVKGFNVDIASRDQLRVGIDFALNKAFRPILQPHTYSIQFVPVYGRGANSNLTHIQDKFVMEIHIHHYATDVFQLEENGRIYVKQCGSENRGDAIAELRSNEARIFFAKKFEDAEIEKIRRLKRDIEIYESLLKN